MHPTNANVDVDKKKKPTPTPSTTPPPIAYEVLSSGSFIDIPFCDLGLKGFYSIAKFPKAEHMFNSVTENHKDKVFQE